MAGLERGAVAFPKTGDPQIGEWDDAVILGRSGNAPSGLVSPLAHHNQRVLV
jgi:hypothetical protein